MNPGISILIMTHNRGPILARSLESLAQMRYPSGVDVEVVVVANACTDDTRERVLAFRDRLPGLRCVDEPTQGLGHARNRAVRESRLDICAMLDDDIWAEEGWLEALSRAYATTPASIVAGRISLWWLSVERPAWLDGRTAVLLSYLELGDQTFELRRSDAVGANFSFRREVFDRAGPFRNDLDRVGNQLMGGGETFFVRTAMAGGDRLFYVPGAHIRHWVAPHRLLEPYLTGVARGTSYTVARLAEPAGVSWAARSLAAGVARIVSGSLRAAAAAEGSGHHILARVSAAAGRGQVAGTLARVRLGPIGGPSTAQDRP